MKNGLQETINRFQSYINAGTLDPNMPVFTLMAQDIVAPDVIRDWADRANEAGSPNKMVELARKVADDFEEWPVKQVPGRPETRSITGTVIAMES